MDDEEFIIWCEEPHVYKDIDEYIGLIHRWLTLSSWHYKEEKATWCIENSMQHITKAYKAGDTIANIGSEVGFWCG